MVLWSHQDVCKKHCPHIYFICLETPSQDTVICWALLQLNAEKLQWIGLVQEAQQQEGMRHVLHLQVQPPAA